MDSWELLYPPDEFFGQAIYMDYWEHGNYSRPCWVALLLSAAHSQRRGETCPRSPGSSIRKKRMNQV